MVTLTPDVATNTDSITWMCASAADTTRYKHIFNLGQSELGQNKPPMRDSGLQDLPSAVSNTQ